MEYIREEEQIEQQPADNAGENNSGDQGQQPAAPKEITTREAIIQALKGTKEKEEGDEATPRDANAPKSQPGADGSDKGAAASKTEGEADPAATEQPTKVKVPNSWPVHLRKDFDKLDPATQKWVAQREESFAKTVIAQDADRNMGKSVREIAQPYEGIFRAENTTVENAFKSLLNMAYICRRGTPQQKTALILKTAQDFNIQVPGLNSPGGMYAQQNGANGQNPFVAQLQNTIHGLQSTVSELTTRLNNRDTQEKQHADAALDGQIQAFASDPKHAHFETVMPQMTALINAGAAKGLEDAYNQAIWAHPELRETLLPEQVTALAAKQKQANAAKVANAKKAGSSIAGSPGRNAPAASKVNKDMSTRDIIKASIAEVRDNT